MSPLTVPCRVIIANTIEIFGLYGCKPYWPWDRRVQSERCFARVYGLHVSIPSYRVLGGTPGPIGVWWINDNAAAIAWAEEGRCKSLAGQYAFLVVTWHLMSSSFRVTQTEHQAGFVMGDIDRLSRGMRHDLDPRCEYILDDQRLQQLDELFSILDPSVVRNLEDHHYALSAVISVARALSRR